MGEQTATIVPGGACATSLPPELVEHLWSFLPLRDLLRVGLVCRDWQALASTHTFWRFVYENRLGGPLQDDMSMDWDESTGVTRYNLAVANTLAKLQSKLQLVEQQLEKEEVNTKAEARKERDTTTQQRDGETAEHMDSRVGDGSGRDVAIEKRRHKQRDLSAYGDLDYRSALLMEEEFVWAMHEKHHRLVDEVLRRMDARGIKRTILDSMNAAKRSMVEDKWRRTPLHRAAEAGSLDAAHYWNRGAAAPIIKLLIAYGAEVNVIDCQQKTPLDKATEPDSAQLLIEHGALKRAQLPADHDDTDAAS